MAVLSSLFFMVEGSPFFCNRLSSGGLLGCINWLLVEVFVILPNHPRKYFSFLVSLEVCLILSSQKESTWQQVCWPGLERIAFMCYMFQSFFTFGSEWLRCPRSIEQNCKENSYNCWAVSLTCYRAKGKQMVFMAFWKQYGSKLPVLETSNIAVFFSMCILYSIKFMVTPLINFESTFFCTLHKYWLHKPVTMPCMLNNASYACLSVNTSVDHQSVDYVSLQKDFKILWT